MSAHLTHRNLDAAWPLSLSPSFMPRWLRDATGFTRAVVSDALDMGALTQFYSLEDIAVAAVAAGNDVLVFSLNAAAHGGPVEHEAEPHLPQRLTAAFAAAVRDGRLTGAQLCAAQARAVALAHACGRR